MSFQIVERKAQAAAPPPVACDCCEGVTEGLADASDAFRRAIWLVLVMNGAMFLVEIVAGQLAGSMALQADALDFAGDTATYGVSLFALGRSDAFRSRTALGKSLVMGAMAIYVLGSAVWRTFVAGAPQAITMGAIGLIALAVNVAAALVLLRFRDGDANARSVWLCSRNDAIGNLFVLAAAGVVAWTGTRWADLAVAAVMAALFLNTAWQIGVRSLTELRGAASGASVGLGRRPA